MPKSTVVSMRMEEGQERRLARMARRLGRSTSETGALLVEEGLRRSEFAFIDFRETAVGRQAFLQGSRVPVWMVTRIARSYGSDLEKTAQHLCRPLLHIKAALSYAKAYPREIEAAIQDNDAADFESLSRLLPAAEVFDASEHGRRTRR
jgi:uncharacterized protein (DUF433 family)